MEKTRVHNKLADVAGNICRAIPRRSQVYMHAAAQLLAASASHGCTTDQGLTFVSVSAQLQNLRGMT